MGKRGISILAVLIVGVLVCLGLIYTFSHRTAAPVFPPRESLSTHPELYTYYDEATRALQDIQTSSTIAQPYLHVGLELATIGSVTKDPAWYEAALHIYEQGDAALQGKNSIILMNIADTHENLGKFDDAKSTLERAIALSPGDASLYELLVALLRNKMHASSDEILAVYADAIKHVYGGGSLYVSRAGYYRDIGKFTEARADFALAHSGGVISDAAYAAALAELEAAEKK